MGSQVNFTELKHTIARVIATLTIVFLLTVLGANVETETPGRIWPWKCVCRLWKGIFVAGASFAYALVVAGIFYLISRFSNVKAH